MTLLYATIPLGPDQDALMWQELFPPLINL